MSDPPVISAIRTFPTDSALPWAERTPWAENFSVTFSPTRLEEGPLFENQKVARVRHERKGLWLRLACSFSGQQMEGPFSSSTLNGLVKILYNNLVQTK
jgi:hypothetical protein